MDALVDGAYAGDYYMGGDKIDLTIIGRGEFASRTQDLAALVDRHSQRGHLAPLIAVAEVALSQRARTNQPP